MSIEELFLYSGYIFCLVATIYMFKVGEIKVACIFLIALLLQFQAVIISPLIEPIENLGECWARTGDHYACTPLAQKLTLHASQFGQFVFGAAILIAAKRFKKLGNE